MHWATCVVETRSGQRTACEIALPAGQNIFITSTLGEEASTAKGLAITINLAALGIRLAFAMGHQAHTNDLIIAVATELRIQHLQHERSSKLEFRGRKAVKLRRVAVGEDRKGGRSIAAALCLARM